MPAALNASSLLSAWESGASQPPVGRALTLLCAAFPHVSPAEWAQSRIGDRDRSLISLREELFGTHVETTAQCPQCAERLEMNFETREMITPQAQLKSGETLQAAWGEIEVAFRLPASADLLAEAASSDPRAGLLRRCIQRAARNGAEIEFSAIPEPALAAVVDAMAEADPQADLRVDLECPVCGHRWQMIFDVVAYLWSEVEDWARRTLRDVHVLASAYGWRESDVLALTAARRHLYVEMALA